MAHNHTESAMTLALDAACELGNTLDELRRALAAGQALGALGIGMAVERQAADVIGTLAALRIAVKRAGMVP